MLIVDLDGPILDVARRYFAAHLRAAATICGESACRDFDTFWAAKRVSASPRQLLLSGDANEYAIQFKQIVEADDLMELDRLQTGALKALARLGATYQTVVLSQRCNQVGARATVIRLGITAVAPVHFVAHGPEGKVPRARDLAVGRNVVGVIGDTEADATVAIALKTPFYGVTCGIRDEARLRREGATAVFDSLAEAAAHLAAPRMP